MAADLPTLGLGESTLSVGGSSTSEPSSGGGGGGSGGSVLLPLDLLDDIVASKRSLLQEVPCNDKLRSLSLLFPVLPDRADNVMPGSYGLCSALPWQQSSYSQTNYSGHHNVLAPYLDAVITVSPCAQTSRSCARRGDDCD